MGLLNSIKGWWNRMFTSAVKKEYNVAGIESQDMRNAMDLWVNIYQGSAPWVSAEDEIKTIKFAKKICSELALLTTLDIDVAFDGKRKEYMQKFFDDSIKKQLREWVELGCAMGTIILKPNGEGVDIITPDRFEIVAKDGNRNVTGIVFQDTHIEDDLIYTKLEYHRFWKANVKISENEEYKEMTYYTITNRTFCSKDSNSIGHPVPLADTKWSNLQDEMHIAKRSDEGLNSMLFGLFRMPSANEIDLGSPLGMSVFSNAIEELKDLDIAYSRNATEIKESRRTVLVDDRLAMLPSTIGSDGKVIKHRLKLPKFVRNVMGEDGNSFYQEINPTINIEQRKQQIDFQLNLIGCKCGFSNGYFVLDEKTGMITATQVEADDRETIQLVKDVRDALSGALDDLFYAQSVFADLYAYAPIGEYEANYNFGDITYNYEEDKARWWSYVQANKVPAWKYFVKFEGMSEEEAKEMIEEASAGQPGLFDE